MEPNDTEGRVPARPTLNEQEPVHISQSQVKVKSVATVCVVVLAAGGIAYLLVHSLLTLTVTVLATLIAVAMNHAVERLQSWGLSRWLAISAVVTTLLGSLVGILFLILPTAVSQIQELIEQVPKLVASVKQSRLFGFLDRTVDVQRLAQRVQGGEGGDSLQKVAGSALQAVSGAVVFVAAIFTILFLVIFMLASGGRLVRGALREALPKHREVYERVLGKVYRSVGGYLSGLTMIALLNAVLMATFLAIIRVPFFLPLGVLSGLGSLIPFLGATLSGAVIALIAFASNGLWAAVAVVAYATFYQLFENHAVAPLVYKRTVELNPLITLLGVLLFAEWAGVVGALIAVPIIAAGQIIVRELLLLRRERLGLPAEGDVAKALRSRLRFGRRRHA